MSSARKPAPRLPRPAARYWKGKAPKGAGEADSDSDYDEEAEQQQQPQDDGDVLIHDVGEDGDEEDGLTLGAAVNKQRKPGAISVTLRGVVPDGKTQEELAAEGDEDEEEEDEEDEEAEEEEEESSEEESESEEEEAPKPQFRPVFIPKRARVTVAEKEALTQDSEEALKRKEQEIEERKKASHDMVAESIRRELLEKEKEEQTPDVDDTDGLDPAGEFEAWRLRELARIKRDKEAELARELEREEIERRRALPEEQRLKEDMERAEQSRKEKPKGQQKFLQKYWHKGAFHQDDEVLRRHDYTEATESTVDVSMLPKVMQVKNFGKRGRTKYTHLLDQDTTAGSGGFGGTASVKAGGTSTAAGGCFLCGGPHLKKDCPQNVNPPPGRIGTGANDTPSGFGSRTWGSRSEETDKGQRSWRDRGEDRRQGGDDRDRRRDDQRARDRERYYRDDRDRLGGRDRQEKFSRDRYDDRSRSPRYRRDMHERRSQERSVERGHHDKRRRID